MIAVKVKSRPWIRTARLSGVKDVYIDVIGGSGAPSRPFIHMQHLIAHDTYDVELG